MIKLISKQTRIFKGGGSSPRSKKSSRKVDWNKVKQDPNVQYRAYTNGQVVVDDVAPGNVGLDWLRRPRMIDFNLQTVPEWTAQGFTLKKGGKL